MNIFIEFDTTVKGNPLSTFQQSIVAFFVNRIMELRSSSARQVVWQAGCRRLPVVVDTFKVS